MQFRSIPLIAAILFVCGALLINARSSTDNSMSAYLPPLPVGQRVEISVEPREPTGESLERLTGTLVSVDDEWVQMLGDFGDECWIPRERVILVQVKEDA